MSAVDRWDPAVYARDGGFVPELGRDLVAWLEPRPGERILDLGCGDGALSVLLSQAGAEVVGVDSSTRQVEAARARGLRAELVDATRLPASLGSFDAVFSNAALHWMKDADRALRAVHARLRPGGRFVAELGAAGNVASVHRAFLAALEARGLDAAPHDPWFFPEPADYERRLRRAGFEVLRLLRFERPTRLPGELSGWLELFGLPFLEAVPAEQRPALVAELVDVLREELRQPDGSWLLDYVRLRFVALRAV